MIVATFATVVLLMVLGSVLAEVTGRKVKMQEMEVKAATWFTEEAKQDIALYIAEKRGPLVRSRMLVNAMKKHVGKPNYMELMRRERAIMPPNCILGNLPLPA